MQAALQEGAATSRPSLPYASAIAPFLVRGWAIVGVAESDMSNSAAITGMIFIVRFLVANRVPMCGG
jgi:hypothetical protein